MGSGVFVLWAMTERTVRRQTVHQSNVSTVDHVPWQATPGLVTVHNIIKVSTFIFTLRWSVTLACCYALIAGGLGRNP